LASLGSSLLVHSARLLSSNSTVSMCRYLAAFCVIYFEIRLSCQPINHTILTVSVLVIFSSALFSIGQIFGDFWGLLTNSCLLVCMVSSSFHFV
jgi:hypothetical protein